MGDNVFPVVEGRESEEWMLVDCGKFGILMHWNGTVVFFHIWRYRYVCVVVAGSIVVHVFRDDVRGEYNLEEMWRKRRPANIKDIGL